MIEIKFGKEESSNPTGGFEKYGTSDKILAGTFIDFICLEDKTYLFAEVTEAFPSAELQPGDIYIKEAITDKTIDGSLNLFLNGGNKEFISELQKQLNFEKIKELISKITIKELLNGENANEDFKQIASHSPIVTTEIDENIFNSKRSVRQAIKSKQKTLKK